MTGSIAGIDPHQDSFTVGIIDTNGVEIAHDSFPNTGTGFVDAIDLLTTHSVDVVGVEGSGKLGSQVSVALTAAGLDAREVPPQRSAIQRRARRLDKTDALDSVSIARALAAEPTLGPVQTLELYDPLVAKLQAVLEQRHVLVERRTLLLQHVGDQLAKLPVDVRDQLDTSGKIESRLRRLETLELREASTLAGQYRLECLQSLALQDREERCEIRRLERLINHLLDEHGTTLRDESGVGPIAAATLLCQVGDPNRFSRESKFARWCGTGAVALSSGEGSGQPVRHRLDLGGNRRINSVLYMASITQQRRNPQAIAYLQRKTSEGKTKKEARRCHKRHLANRIIRRMWKDEKHRQKQLSNLLH